MKHLISPSRTQRSTRTVELVQAAPTVRTKPRPFSKRGFIDQVRCTFQKQNRLALAIGTVLGGFVPGATFATKLAAHDQPMLWALVAGGLAYSAPTVMSMMQKATGSRMKACGWVLLVEGLMVFSPMPWLSAMALAILIASNAVSTAVKLADDARE